MPTTADVIKLIRANPKLGANRDQFQNALTVWRRVSKKVGKLFADGVKVPKELKIENQQLRENARAHLREFVEDIQGVAPRQLNAALIVQSIFEEYHLEDKHDIEDLMTLFYVDRQRDLPKVAGNKREGSEELEEKSQGDGIPVPQRKRALVGVDESLETEPTDNLSLTRDMSEVQEVKKEKDTTQEMLAALHDIRKPSSLSDLISPPPRNPNLDLPVEEQIRGKMSAIHTIGKQARMKTAVKKEAMLAETEAAIQQGIIAPPLLEVKRETRELEETKKQGEVKDENRAVAMIRGFPDPVPLPSGGIQDTSHDAPMAIESVTGGGSQVSGVVRHGVMPSAPPQPVLRLSESSSSSSSRSRSLPNMIAIPSLNGDANSTYLSSGAGGSFTGHNDIFAARAKRVEMKQLFSDNLWWLNNPLKLDNIDKQMARAAILSKEPNVEHEKRQRQFAEKELMRTPRYRLYAGSDHVAEEVLSHKSY